MKRNLNHTPSASRAMALSLTLSAATVAVEDESTSISRVESPDRVRVVDRCFAFWTPVTLRQPA